ncbi:MAG: tyrosine-protein phosphatase [Sporolactobacillus sp.]
MKKRFAIALLLLLCMLAPGADALAASGSTAISLPHSIGLTGVNNARNLGGYMASSGKSVKMGVLLRSARLQRATAADLSILKNQYHLTQIIDLRTSKEAAEHPDPAISGVIETSLPLLSEKEKLGDMKEEYADMVTDDYSISALKQFFTLVLKHRQGALLFHCTAGKDRTGVAAMLLLRALGLSKATVIQDYLLSNRYYGKTVVQKNWADDVFDIIDSQYGSTLHFLESRVGLTADQINQLRAQYLQ